jgi:hypothetical protein
VARRGKVDEEGREKEEKRGKYSKVSKRKAKEGRSRNGHVVLASHVLAVDGKRKVLCHDLRGSESVRVAFGAER